MAGETKVTLQKEPQGDPAAVHGCTTESDAILSAAHAESAWSGMCLWGAPVSGTFDEV
jgi:hypothetical protein